jgi:Mn2+/Fe2+ NRAMP family transporter
MPRWDVGELPDAPKFTGRNWAMLIGPGLVMGGAAIGGGEWITGPAVTARYGASLMWLATLSILFQVVYNMEISRYTLYSGEPIFTGKFRLLPSPRFWLVTYLILDCGSIFPYLVANAATPLAALVLGHIPDANSTEVTNVLGIDVTDGTVFRVATYVAFFLAVIPLIFGGKVFNSLKAIMSVKIVYVLVFLTFLAVYFSTPQDWIGVAKGLVGIGTIPIERGEDLNGNGELDDGEDWDGDGHLDVVEPRFAKTIDTDGDRKPDAWGDANSDGKVDKYDRWLDIDGDKTRDGDNVDNIFVALFSGRAIPPIQLSMIGMLAAMVAISGSGGLTNTSISGYTRDQGWGMGKHVGCIPSAVGRKQFRLSHVGMVFQVTQESLARFRRWYRHCLRDQLVVWMPACFVGIVLPSMLSLVFLKRGTEAANEWEVPAMTAEGVSDAITGAWGSEAMGSLFWYLTLFCGLIILWPSAATTADGVLRRWVDVFWTGSPRLRKWKTDSIAWLYFAVLCAYAVFGIITLSFERPTTLLQIAATIYNYALGFSCFHVLAVNLILLPKELRPNWLIRAGLVLAGCYFLLLAVVTTLEKLGYFA